MALPKRILVPTDFSAAAAGALDYAKTLAEAVGASLQVLAVMDDPLPGIKMADHVCSIPAIRQQIERETGEHLAKVLTPAEQAKFRAELTAVWGNPYAKILEFAKDHAIDLIVMGTHGRGAILHALLGSVAERIVRHASCPVLTIRPAPETAPAKAVSAALAEAIAPA
jgi:nucleotide-binding universal stress UspA family protein